MRLVFFFIGLFLVHRVLVQVYPPYRVRFQEFDRKVTWITVILVLYLVGNAIYILLLR